MDEKTAFEVKITRDVDTKIYVKANDKWEEALKAHGEPIDASTRIKKAFGIERFYPVPHFTTTDTARATIRINNVTFYLTDDFDDQWHFLKVVNTNAYQINLAFLRCEGIKDGITAKESTLFSKAELEMFAEAIMRAYRKAYVRYCRPFEISLMMKTREPVYENGFTEEEVNQEGDKRADEVRF